MFVSDYILDELGKVLNEELNEGLRYVELAKSAVRRRATRIKLPPHIRAYVPGDPNDDPVVQTAISSKSDYLVTADLSLLALGKVQDVKIISVSNFAELLPA